MDIKPKQTKLKPRQGKKLLTIGVFNSWKAVWNRRDLQGMVDEFQINMFVFNGGRLRKNNQSNDFQYQRNSVYYLASNERLDGIKIDYGVGCEPEYSTEEVNKFIDRFRKLPLVSIYAPLENMPGIYCDAYRGGYELVLHLIEVHGYQKIGFIMGWENLVNAKEKFRAYQDALDKYNIPIRPEMIVPGDYTDTAGKKAVATLLDERKVTFQALICADDDMAIGAINELYDRGLRVPQNMRHRKF